MCAYYLWILLNNIFIAFAYILFLLSIMEHQTILCQFTKQEVIFISIGYRYLDCEGGCAREWCGFLFIFFVMFKVSFRL